MSRFASCAVSNSHPIDLCEKCVESYIDILDTYETLSQVDYL